MKHNLLIIGAGQYGYVAKEIAESLNEYEKIDFLDDNNEEAIDKVSNLSNFKNDYDRAIVSIGNPEVREKLTKELLDNNFILAKLISPKAYVSNSSTVGDGSIVEPMAVVNANSKVGISTLVCAGAIINHNAIVKDFCQINCGSVVKPNSIVENKIKTEYNSVV